MQTKLDSGRIKTMNIIGIKTTFYAVLTAFVIILSGCGSTNQQVEDNSSATIAQILANLQNVRTYSESDMQSNSKLDFNSHVFVSLEANNSGNYQQANDSGGEGYDDFRISSGVNSSIFLSFEGIDSVDYVELIDSQTLATKSMKRTDGKKFAKIFKVEPSTTYTVRVYHNGKGGTSQFYVSPSVAANNSVSISDCVKTHKLSANGIIVPRDITDVNTSADTNKTIGDIDAGILGYAAIKGTVKAIYKIKALGPKTIEYDGEKYTYNQTENAWEGQDGKKLNTIYLNYANDDEDSDAGDDDSKADIFDDINKYVIQAKEEAEAENTAQQQQQIIDENSNNSDDDTNSNSDDAGDDDTDNNTGSTGNLGGGDDDSDDGSWLEDAGVGIVVTCAVCGF